MLVGKNVDLWTLGGSVVTKIGWDETWLVAGGSWAFARAVRRKYVCVSVAGHRRVERDGSKEVRGEMEA